MLSDLIVCYLFLGGTGAGMCFVLAVLGLLVPRACLPGSVPGPRDRSVAAPYRPLFAAGFLVAFAALALGIVCLLADLGNVERVVFLFTQPSWSFIAVGTWLLAACALVAAVLSLVWLGYGPRAAASIRLLEIATLLVAAGVMVYTGLLLQSLRAVPLWSTPWLPVLFVASSLSCGMAGVLGTAQFTGAARTFATTLRRLAVVDAAVIVIEMFVVVAFVATALWNAGSASSSGTAAAARASVNALVMGEGAWLFWGGFVLIGLVIPLVLDGAFARMRRAMPGVALAAVACVLTGGFIMRLSIVGAGMHPLLTSGAL